MHEQIKTPHKRDSFHPRALKPTKPALIKNLPYWKKSHIFTTFYCKRDLVFYGIATYIYALISSA